MSDTLIESYEHAGLTVEIHADWDAESPRDWDNVGTLYLPAMDSTAELPARAHNYSAAESRPLEFAGRYIELTGGVALPVQFSDYGSSGARISAGTADELRGCDDWANGLIWATPEKIAAEWVAYGVLADEARSRARAALVQEIETYNLWLEGGFTGYVILTPAGETLDSCWGIDDPEYCRDLANQVAELEAEHCAELRRKRGPALRRAGMFS